MSGGGSPSSSSSPPHPNSRHPPPPPLNTLASQHGSAEPKQPSLQQRRQQRRQQQQQQTPPLLLTVRFSTSIPDLLLDIPHPRRTTAAALKHLIRSRLDPPDSQRRLRFIHGGKILPDGAVLASVLKALPPPPPAAGPGGKNGNDDHDHHDSGRGEGKGKGKGKGKSVEGAGRQAHRVYVNCSIGDVLTGAELEEERRKAEEPVPDQQEGTTGGSGDADDSAADGVAARDHNGSMLASPFRPAGTLRRSPGHGGAGSAPRGFDRLLTTGFTAAEVNQLRLQFRSIQEARHTADTMPSPDALRSLEDAWIDNNNDGGVAGGGGGAAAAPTGDGEGGGVAAGEDEASLAGVLDILLRGMFIGFVWPLGAVGWLVRDEEKIPKRMRVFVYFGFVLSLLIGTIRTIG